MTRLSDRARTGLSVTLAALALVLGAGGGAVLYLRATLVNESSFAARARSALREEPVRRVVSRQIVTRLIERGSGDLISARPLLEAVVSTVIGTPAFQRLFDDAVRDAHRLLFDRSGTVQIDVADSASLLTGALRSSAPKIARQLPSKLSIDVVKFREGELGTKTLRAADDVRTFGIVLPILAVLLLIGSVAVAVDRRAAVVRAGGAIVGAGALLVLILIAGRSAVLAQLHGDDVLTQEEARAAGGAVFDSFFGDLKTLALMAAALGVVTIAVAVVPPQELEVDDRVERVVRRLFREPATTFGKSARALGAAVLGALVLWRPGMAVDIATILIGLYLLFFGTSELIQLLGRRRATAGADHPDHPDYDPLLPRPAAIGLGIAFVGGLALLAVLAISSLGPKHGAAAAQASFVVPGGCNGSRALCSRRLNEIVWPGTHNSMSAADLPGWYLANQRRPIPRQLADGIRLFLIDPHWGVRDPSTGRVRTDLQADGTDRNHVAAALGPKGTRLAESLGGTLGLGALSGKRDVYLCHTVCELGSIPMVAALKQFKTFLGAHRGEVVVLFLEPYVPSGLIEDAFRKAGLLDQLAVIHRDEPLPTLGELVKANTRVVVLGERDTGPQPWYLDGFAYVQDTPLGSKSFAQFSCALERGSANSPLLMVNHWIDKFPPPISANVKIETRAKLLERVQQCERERHQMVNFLPVDFYDAGAVVQVARELNQRPLPAVLKAAGAKPAAPGAPVSGAKAPVEK